MLNEFLKDQIGEVPLSIRFEHGNILWVLMGLLLVLTAAILIYRVSA